MSLIGNLWVAICEKLTFDYYYFNVVKKSEPILTSHFQHSESFSMSYRRFAAMEN